MTWLPRHAVVLFAVSFALVFGSPGTPLRGAEDDEPFLVRCARPCASIKAMVETSGGRVTQAYQNVDLVAVRVPKASVGALLSAAGFDAVRKDLEVQPPRLTAMLDVTKALLSSVATAVPTALDAPAVQPADYDHALELVNVASLHKAGKLGQDVIVAVIDSGTVNVPGFVPLAGSVIGGETFVPANVDPLSATHRQNGSHGTMTAEMIAAHANLAFDTKSEFVEAIARYAPANATACARLPNACGLPPASAAMASLVPMTGAAPAARIYAMKVFPANGDSAPTSRNIAAIDRAITLRRNYNRTGANVVQSGTGTETDPFVYSALKIDVVNMSFGGGTLFAGNDLEDQLTLSLLDVGITPVVAAGNDGFAAMTGGSPGTGLGALTVGAASTAVNERIVADLQFGPGAGALYRPTNHLQTAWFSSRGPTADGRIDPDILANGDYAYVQAYLAESNTGDLVDCRVRGARRSTCMPRIVFSSGSSLAAPTVAGAAAVLRAAHPAATAIEIRNALQFSADARALGDGSTAIDQGNGLLNVAAADRRLVRGKVSGEVPDLRKFSAADEEDALGAGGGSVLMNVERAGFQLARFTKDRYSARLQNLKPGQVAQIFVPSDATTSRLTVTIDQVTPSLPPPKQNQFYGYDDVFYMIADAPTSFFFEQASGYVGKADGSVTHTIDHPQTGLVRVAVQGDWVNAGAVSARVTIARERTPDPAPSATSFIDQDEIRYVEVDVPPRTAKLVFELAWLQNWSRYPTNDLDLVLFDPAGKVNVSGSTVRSPERVEIKKPAPGRWRAAIVGLTVHGSLDGPGGKPRDTYTFSAVADGASLPAVK